MLIKSVRQGAVVTANDGCQLVELLHPKNDPVSLPYSLAIAEVAPHQSSYRHRLAQDEVYYLLSGVGVMHVDEQTSTVKAGDAIHIPAGAVQWIENPASEPLRFAAIVSPPWTAADDERL